MSKERFLTVLVPISDGDCEATVYGSLAALQTAVPASASNTNKIYKVSDGTYYRSKMVGGTYSYVAVTDREFPFLGEPMEIYDFKYDATRMGNAPTISAQGIMMYADKDGQGLDVTLEDLWTQECHVSFNGEKFYLKRIPTSSKSNEDARYKYDMDFVSQRVVLEQVYLYDVVQPYVTERPLSESATFSFYGDINELAKRINASLIRSGLATLTRKYVHYDDPYYEELLPSTIVPYLTYEQWSLINVNPHSLVPEVFGSDYEWQVFRYEIYRPLNGDYNLYLMDYIYENDNGVYTLSGYQCKIGKDKEGNVSTSEEKLITFDNNKIHEALQQFHDTFGLQYYIKCEKDSSGNSTGNISIMVADCEHDFADVTGYDQDGEPIYQRDSNGIPTTSAPLDYGSTEALMSKEKANTTDSIVTRITGVGSSENIPWYYPNPTPDGWIKPIFTRDGEPMQGVTVDYPVDEGSTAEDYARYERFLKNRLGASIDKGAVKGLYFDNDCKVVVQMPSDDYWEFVVYYVIKTQDIIYPNITLELDYNPSESQCSRLQASLNRGDVVVGTYDSDETYADPSYFQTMFVERDGKHLQPLASGYDYNLSIAYTIPKADMPYSKVVDFEGYHYPSRSIAVGQTGLYAYIGENFYEVPNLLPFVDYQISTETGHIYIYDAGYSTNGEASGRVSPLLRMKDKQYKDISTNTIYNCYTSEATNVTNGSNIYAFTANPVMSCDEWFRTFVSMRIRLYANDGWYIGGTKINLEDYGLGTPYIDEQSAFYTYIFDSIEFQRVKYVTPQQNLMPELYIKTDGERRFYDAHNYWDEANGTLYDGTADPMLGEVQVDSKVRNPIYKEKETDPDSKHYKFENEYLKNIPHEHIENFDDAKPSIEGQRNEVGGTLIRIDVVEEFGYDLTDNDEIWESNDGGSVSGDYKHPYFFAKLRPMGFNIFDLALQDEMVISMTTGNCGACNFKIGVDERTGKNPVQIWEYDVYDGDDPNTAQLVYEAKTLRRYVNLAGLYYDTPDGFIPVAKNMLIVDGGQSDYLTSVYDRYTYSAESVEKGLVGCVKQDGKKHFEGDVVTNGRFLDSQQDTSENYVWVALMKDTETYGVIMPAARPYYDDHQFDIYIEPKGIEYTNRTTGEQSTLTEDQADKFVLTNIRMPQMYLRRAERFLSRKLVAYMYDNNYQKFNFSIKFSSIFLAQNPSVDGNTNENSVIYVRFNGKTYRQYVKHYTYTMRHDSPLPEITVDMNEELNVSRTLVERQGLERKKNSHLLTSNLGALAQQIEYRMGQRTISKNGTSVVYGNIIMQGTGTSLTQVSQTSSETAQAVQEIQDEVQTIVNENYLEWEEF